MTTSEPVVTSGPPILIDLVLRLGVTGAGRSEILSALLGPMSLHPGPVAAVNLVALTSVGMKPSHRLDTSTADGHDRHVPTGSHDILSAGHEGVYDWAAEHLVRSGSRFLDFGCGTGYGSARVVAAGADYDGIDSSPTAVDYASAHFGHPGVRFYASDLLHPLPHDIVPRTYDVVFSSEVLEHVNDPFRFVASMVEAVRDDGVCFIGTPNRLWSKEHMPRGKLLAESHVMEFTPQALVALLAPIFDEVTLLFRRLPPDADAIIAPAAGRSRLLDASQSFARDLAPDLSRRVKRAIRGRRNERQWSPSDIDWVTADDTELDVVKCVGLVAVCRKPRR